MAWEKVVTAYDSVDKARNAMKVLQNAGHDAADLSIIDSFSVEKTMTRTTLDCGVGCSAKTFGTTKLRCTATQSTRAEPFW